MLEEFTRRWSLRRCRCAGYDLQAYFMNVSPQAAGSF